MNLIFFALVRRHVNVVFATNDDYRMRLIVSGAYTGVPSSQASFLNDMLGRALAGLYRAFPGVEWYGLFYYGSIFLFACTAEGLFLCRARGLSDLGIRLACVVVFSMVILLNHLSMLQFTTIAAFWSALSVTACLMYLESDSFHAKLLWGCVYLASVFMALLVRNLVFLMFLPMELIFFCTDFLDRRSTHRMSWHKLLIDVAVLGLLFVAIVDCRLANDSATHLGKDSDFLKFRTVRSNVYDYSGWADYDENKEFYDSIDFSKAAWDCLNARTFDVNPSVNTENLRAIRDYTNALNRVPWPKKLAKALSGSLDSLASDQTVRELEALAFILFLLFLIARRSSPSSKAAFLMWGSFLYCAACLVALLLRGRIMARVVQSMGIVLCAVILYCTKDLKMPDAAPVNKDFMGRFTVAIKWTIAGVTAVALVASSVSWLSDDDKFPHSTLQRRTDELLAMEAYMADRPNEFLFYNALDFIGGSDYVFSEPREGTLNMDSLGNWNVFSPDYYARNAQFGFTSALDGLLNGRALYARLHKLTPAPIEATLNEYGKTLVKIDELEAAGDTIVIYRAVSLQ